MHQLSHQHAFAPILQLPSSIPPAAAGMGAQDRNVNSSLHRTQFSSSTAIHRATHKSFSAKQVTGRWGALHVCIAWKIYYHKQLKRVQENPSSYREHLTFEGPISRPDSGQYKEEPPSYMHPYLHSQRGHLVYGNIRDRSEAGKMPSAVSHRRSYPAHLHIPSTRRENPDERGRKPHAAEDLPAADVSCHLRVSPERDGGRRKRPFECEGFEKVKRAKQEVVDFHSHPSHFITTRSYLSSHGVQLQHMSDLSAVYSNSSRYNVSYPGTELHHYKTAPWEPLWDTRKRLELHAGRNIPKDTSLNICKANRTHFVTERQRKEVSRGFFTPPLCFPVALRSQSPLQGSASSCWPSGNIQPGPPGLHGLPEKKTQQMYHSQNVRDVRLLGEISG